MLAGFILRDAHQVLVDHGTWLAGYWLAKGDRDRAMDPFKGEKLRPVIELALLEGNNLARERIGKAYWDAGACG